MAEQAKMMFITVWMGKLPSYLPLWLNSCRNNPTVDFLMITNDECDKSGCPENVHVLQLTIGGLKERIQKNFDFPISFERGYKSCDFRPAFGEIFSDILKGYDFWGHCDPDMIWGNIREFFTPDNLSRYDRLRVSGACSLYRNDPQVNAWYKTMDPMGCMNWKEVFQRSDTCAFDEMAGWNGGGSAMIATKNKKKLENVVDFADLNATKAKLVIYDQPDVCSREDVYYLYDHGTLSACADGEKIRDELYLHFSQRSPKIADHLDLNHFVFLAPNLVTSDFSEINQKHTAALLQYDWNRTKKRIDRRLKQLFHRNVARS